MDDDMPSEEELRAMAKQWHKDAEDEWLYWMENPLDAETLAMLKASNIDLPPNLLPDDEKSSREQWQAYIDGVKKMLEDDDDE